MSHQDDLKLYHDSLMAQLRADGSRPIDARDIANRLRLAWSAVEADRERRSKEWLRSKGLGDLADDVMTEEPAPEGMRVCDCPNGEAERSFCKCAVPT